MKKEDALKKIEELKQLQKSYIAYYSNAKEELNLLSQERENTEENMSKTFKDLKIAIRDEKGKGAEEGFRSNYKKLDDQLKAIQNKINLHEAFINQFVSDLRYLTSDIAKLLLFIQDSKTLATPTHYKKFKDSLMAIGQEAGCGGAYIRYDFTSYINIELYFCYGVQHLLPSEIIKDIYSCVDTLTTEKGKIIDVNKLSEECEKIINSNYADPKYLDGLMATAIEKHEEYLKESQRHHEAVKAISEFANGKKFIIDYVLKNN